MPLSRTLSLVLILLGLIRHNVEESQLIDVLASAHNAQPVAELLLLEILLCQVLQIPARKLLVCHNLYLAIARLVDINQIAEIACPAIDLDPVVQELFKGRNIKDLVGSGL